MLLRLLFLLDAAGGGARRLHPLLQLLRRKHPELAVGGAVHLVFWVTRHAADVDDLTVSFGVLNTPVKTWIRLACLRINALRLDLAAA